MSTPTCPACGAKFSHDGAFNCCKKCGLPDEILTQGPTSIKQWQCGKLPYARQQAKVEFPEKRGARKSRRPNKHGRKGVRRATSNH